jgi:hypothetical protein
MLFQALVLKTDDQLCLILISGFLMAFGRMGASLQQIPKLW